MPALRIVLDPERQGLGMEPAAGRELIHLGNDAEIVVTGLPDGMASGPDGKKRASVALAFMLPSGDMVLAETSWRLFATAYNAFLGKFGEADYPGMRVEMPDEGRALEFVASEEPFVQCGSCSWRLEGKNTKESVEHLVREYERHYRKKHRGVPPPASVPGAQLMGASAAAEAALSGLVGILDEIAQTAPLVPAPPAEGVCVYCGGWARDGLTCSRHVDLMLVDLDYFARRSRGELFLSDRDDPPAIAWQNHRLRKWWLDRFTADELLELASGLTELAA